MKTETFRKIFLILRDADLFKNGPRPINIDLQKEDSLRNAIEEGASRIPALYYDSYVSPLLKNLKWVMKKVTIPSLETLAGAIYDHGAQYANNDDRIQLTRRLQGFLAVTSNLYRSFLEPEPSAKGTPPSPASIPPPLATFRPELHLKQGEFGPFTLPIDEVERLCGGRTAVVSLPSSYSNHPVLCWGAIAHEVGGHDVLHAYSGLLLELQRGVRKLFYHGPDPNGAPPESDEQFLGLLWQYWTEEAASDVCAVLNLGPAYGPGIAAFFSAFNERIIRLRKEEAGEPASLGTEPLLTVSWPPNQNYAIPSVDSHPTDILKLNVIIGAIESLPLALNVKTGYIKKIRNCIDYSLAIDKKENKRDNKYVEISGYFSFKPGKISRVDHKNPKKILRTTMEENARRVGRFIASETMESLNGNNLQDLETWDEADEAFAVNIKNELSKEHVQNPLFSYLGDDSQLMAGALLALFENPNIENYQKINNWLVDALVASWYWDPIWGLPIWHPLTGEQPRNMGMEDIMKEEKKRALVSH